jgi:hypothetical protein
VKNISILVSLSLVLLLSGCAYFGNEEQYNNGNWHFLASSGEVARIKQDKLALKKLEQTPVLTGTRQNLGYEGIVKNYTKEIIDVKVVGPEKKSWNLGPYEEAIGYLIPGEYERTIICRGKLVLMEAFTVGGELHDFRGRNYHWYIYAINK